MPTRHQSGTSSRQPYTRVEGVSNIRLSTIEILDAGEAKNRRNGTFHNQGAFSPEFSFNLDSDSTNGSLRCHYSSTSKDFHLSPPPQRHAREPNTAMSHTAHDERPPNVGLWTLQSGPVTHMEGVSNVRLSNVAVSNAGEAKNG